MSDEPKRCPQCHGHGYFACAQCSPGEPMHVFVINGPYGDMRIAHSLYDIACELEAMLA